MKIGWRIWLLIIAVVLALLSISPWGYFAKGVIVKSVDRNSSAFESGLRQGMIIESINFNTIGNMQDYTSTITKIFNNQNNTIKLDIKTSDSEFIFLANSASDITVGDIPKTKIKTGLDLSGGARALVQPVNVSLSSSEMSDLISVTSQRFNVFGISDISIRPVTDLLGNNYMLVEIAGATPSDLQDLVSQQGKFEAKIGNDTVFSGGKKDITQVCRNNAQCAGIQSCGQIQGGYSCNFFFTITLSPDAAQRQADVTSQLGINDTNTQYLDKKLDLYLDDNLVDSLFISTDLKGKVETQIQIQGSGAGSTQAEAVADAQASMNKLQTILITGSLPYKLQIVKLDTISPVLGAKFINYLLFAGVAAFVAVSLIVFIRYRRIKASLAILLINLCELILILGVAALIKWNLDLASIAGILTTIGTGVDQEIIMIDEARRKQEEGMIEKMKRALFIIVGAYFTALASLLPLYWAGGGLLRGFAVTTIIGITVGVLITRPAFAEIVKRFENQNAA